MADRIERHLITPEYPPECGGVGDYTFQLAAKLADSGEPVHVWCPSGNSTPPPALPGVTLHREDFTVAGLRNIDRAFDQCAAPRNVLIQWVPHGYGYRSLNLPFCNWVWKRAAFAHDSFDLMVHEPFLMFGEGSLKQDAAAAIHRLMTMILLNSAKRVWISIPSWERLLRPWAFGRHRAFRWLPVPSNVPVVKDPEATAKARRRYCTGQHILIGHFGTYGRQIRELLGESLPILLNQPNLEILLMGRDSQEYRDQIATSLPQGAASRIHATGQLPAHELSVHLAACDVMIQPYADGVSSRRGSAMAAISHGKPTITTTGKATEPVWSQSGAVLLAAPESATEFAAHTLSLVNQPELRQKLGALAATLYRDHFDIAHTVAQLREASRS